MNDYGFDNDTNGYDLRPTNREKSKKASKSKFWCHSCDAALVGQAKKCPFCGQRANPKKSKY